MYIINIKETNNTARENTTRRNNKDRNMEESILKLLLYNEKLDAESPLFLPAICMLIDEYTYTNGYTTDEVLEMINDAVTRVNAEYGDVGALPYKR